MITSAVVSLIVLLVILGLVFYCIELIPMAAPFPTIIRVIAVILALLIVLQFFGFIGVGHAGIITQ